tara:strand:+ start:2989 stop:3840 length:852 start_codon:yes stop_codon:yes gene_type:complete
MASIPYISGFSIKPAKISGTGVVTFTDGTNEITPNQRQCEAYGYTYNPTTGVCESFKYSSNLSVNLNNENNNIQGFGNVTGVGTNNTYVMGENNEVIDVSRNNILIGSRNKITKPVNNTAVFGTLGEITTSNSLVIGGNSTADTLGERQNTTILYGGQTTDGATTELYLNNTTDSYFQPAINSVFYFQSEILAVRVGGSSAGGAVGDYKSWVERGVVKNANGTLYIRRSQTAIVSTGTTTTWAPENTVSGSDFKLTVNGMRGMTLEWVATIRLTELRTSVTLT